MKKSVLIFAFVTALATIAGSLQAEAGAEIRDCEIAARAAAGLRGPEIAIWPEVVHFAAVRSSWTRAVAVESDW